MTELPVRDTNDIMDDLQYSMSIDEIDEALAMRASTRFGPDHGISISQCGLNRLDYDPHYEAKSFIRFDMNVPTKSNQLDRVASFKSKSLAVFGYVDDIQPTYQWSDAYYFPDSLKNYLQSEQYKLNDMKAIGWPYLMRNESLILIGNRSDYEELCLPIVCANVLVIMFKFNIVFFLQE